MAALCGAAVLAGCSREPAGSSEAEAPASPDGRAGPPELLAELAAVAPGSSFDVAVRIPVAEGWHTYWANPGDAGAPASIAWRLPEGWHAGPIRWPAPQRLEDEGLVSFAYENDAGLLVRLTAPATAAPGETAALAATVSWMTCREICVPHEENVETHLAISPDIRPAAEEARGYVAKLRAALPADGTDWAFEARLADETVTIAFSPPQGVDPRPLRDAQIFPLQRGLLDLAAPQRLTAGEDAWTIEAVRLPGSRGGERFEGILKWVGQAVTINTPWVEEGRMSM